MHMLHWMLSKQVFKFYIRVAQYTRVLPRKHTKRYVFLGVDAFRISSDFYSVIDSRQC